MSLTDFCNDRDEDPLTQFSQIPIIDAFTCQPGEYEDTNLLSPQNHTSV